MVRVFVKYCELLQLTIVISAHDSPHESCRTTMYSNDTNPAWLGCAVNTMLSMEPVKYSVIKLCKVISQKNFFSENDENLRRVVCDIDYVHVNNVVFASSLFLCALHRYSNKQN
jgi:hypothetical protein